MPADARMLDLVQYDRERARGAKFITHLPLKYDACCSGIGHMAAVVRSLEARFAKLTPDESPDIYSVVAQDCYKTCPPVTIKRKDGGQRATT